jgi:signal transduction histidine kinase
MELYIDKVAIKDMCNHAMELLQQQARQKQLRVFASIHPDVPYRVWADEARLRQVLMNLLGNAIKFTQEGEVELIVTKLSGSEQTVSLRFAIRDTGIGIDLDDQMKIFNVFTQADSSTTKKFGGTGLGLSISNRLLSLMSTSLQVKSSIGQGSTFYFDMAMRTAD